MKLRYTYIVNVNRCAGTIDKEDDKLYHYKDIKISNRGSLAYNDVTYI